MFATKNCVQNAKIHPKFLDGMTTDGELSFSPRGRHLSCHRHAGLIIDRTCRIIDTQVGKSIQRDDYVSLSPACPSHAAKQDAHPSHPAAQDAEGRACAQGVCAD